MKKEIENIWMDLNGELYKFVYGRVNDEQVAKDILQEVFLKIQLNINQLKNTSKLTSWVYQITRNTILDYYRKPKKVRTMATSSKNSARAMPTLPIGRNTASAIIVVVVAHLPAKLQHALPPVELRARRSR